MSEGQDGVLLLLEGSLDLIERGPSSDGGSDLSNFGSVGLEAVGESIRPSEYQRCCADRVGEQGSSRIAEVARVEHESVLPRLDEVRSDEIPDQAGVVYQLSPNSATDVLVQCDSL